MHRVIKTGVTEATEAHSLGNAKDMYALANKVAIMENTLYQVKGMMKQRRPEKFEKVKSNIRE